MKKSKLLLISGIWFLLNIFPSFATVTITLNSPPNLAQTIDTTPDFTFTAISDVNLTFSCTLYIDSIAYGTNSSVSNNTATTITANDTLSNGDHNWYINCTDASGTFQSEVRTIGIGANFSRCVVLIDPGANYNLTGDILNSGTSYCINIQANNITLNCQGHTIDGDDIADYGIYVYRSSAQTTNITIKNCVLSDWDTANIYLYNANGNNLENINSTSSPDYGLYLLYSYSNTLTNITANSNGGDGLRLYASNSNTLTNITANSNSYYGLYLYASNSNTLTNITANSNSYYGLYLYASNSNTLTNITANSNSLDGLYLLYSDHTIISSSNFINNSMYDIFYFTTRTDNDCHSSFTDVIGTDNKPIVFYNSTVNIKNWNNNVSEIILCHADYSTINNLTLDHTDKENNGLLLIATYYTNITNSNFIDLRYGLYLLYSDTNTLTNITANSNSYGLYLLYSDTNTLTNITANSNYYGLRLYASDTNTLTNITANSNRYYGLYLYYSNSNTLTNSKIENNANYGIYLYSAGADGANKIYNNIFNNTNNFYFAGTIYTNYWNTTRQPGQRIYSSGVEIGGNYWTNSTGNGYSDTCADADKDGFCDNPYTLATNNIDYLPLSDEYIPSNNPPNKPILNSPPNGATNQPLTVTLNVTVTDPDNDLLNVSFYDINGNLIGEVYNVQSGSFATVTWSGLSYSTTYYWYVNVTDGEYINQSDIWQFTTMSEPSLKILIQKPGAWEILYNNQTRKIIARVGSCEISSPIQIPKNKFTKISLSCCKYNSLKLYINSDLVNVTTCNQPIPSNINPIYVAGNQSGFYFKGAIDEIRISNKTLTDEQITYYELLNIIFHNPSSYTLNNFYILTIINGKKILKEITKTISPGLGILSLLLPEGEIEKIEVTPKECQGIASYYKKVECK